MHLFHKNYRRTIEVINNLKRHPFRGVTAQTVKFPIKDFFSKCEQIRKKLRFIHIYLRDP